MRMKLPHGAMFSLLAVSACGGDDGAKPTVDASTTHDSAIRDAGIADASETVSDAAITQDGCVPFTMPANVDCSAPVDGVLPKDLRCTGLYGDFAAKKVACGLHEYTPAYTLWSDGAAKRRWVSLPEGQHVDVSDPIDFVYPVGTRFWKEFRVKDATGADRLVETRLEVKTDAGWVYTSYVWSDDQQTATQMNNDTGATNVAKTGHDVPTRDQCNECHNGRTDWVLGWDAIMLGKGASGVTRETLATLGLATDASSLTQTIPGNDVEREALGYLHANCGISCHNDKPDSKGGDSGLRLRLEKDALASVQTTAAYKTGINKAPSLNAKLGGLPAIGGAWYDVRPLDPARSLLVVRQTLRGVDSQMPRIATHDVDDAGVQATTAWVNSMTPDAGYPAPAP